MFRKIRVVEDGLSRKVLAGALAAVLVGIATRYGFKLGKEVEILVEAFAFFAAGWFVPEETE